MAHDNDHLLARFLPNQLLGDLAADVRPGQASPVGSVSTLARRRHVTVLFADLAGFTALAERLDPERVVALLNRWFDEVARIAAPLGGQIDKFLGDACQVIFLDEGAGAAGATRAVRAALLLQERMAQLDEAALDLRCTCAIEAGEAVVALLVGGERAECTVIGEVVGAAAALQKLCPPGEILLGPGAAAALDPQGMEIAVEPFAGEGARVRPARALRHDEPGLFGRTEVVQALDGALERLAEGSGGALLVSARAGAGRSRVLEALVRRAASRNLPVLVRPPAGAAPAAWLRSLFGQALPAALELLESPALEALAAAGTEALCRLAGEGPFVVAVDDVHLLDAPSRRVLTRMLPLLQQRSALVVATARVQERDDGTVVLPICGFGDRIHLGPLPLFEAKRLLAALLPERASDHPWLEREVRSRGGWPGALTRSTAREVDIHELLERLPPTATALCHVLAALGPTEEPVALEVALADAGACALPPEPDRHEGWSVTALADRLVADGLLRRAGGALLFDRPEVAEALRARLGVAAAQRLHGRAADVAGRLGRRDEALHHRSLGAAGEAAVEAHAELAQRLLAFGCTDEARGHVLAALDRVQQDRLASQVARLRILEGRILRAQGLFEEAASVLLTAHGAAAQPAQRVDSALELAALFAERGRTELAHDCLARARAAAGDDAALVERVQAACPVREPAKPDQRQPCCGDTPSCATCPFPTGSRG